MKMTNIGRAAAFAACMMITVPAFAQSGTALPADPFAAPYALAVVSFRSLAGFSSAVQATPAVSPAGWTPAPPYDLEDLIVLAASGNTGLASAASSIAAANADLAGARARRLPGLSAQTSGSYVGNPIGPISVTAGQFGTYQDVLIPPRDMVIYKGMESTYYEFKLIGEAPLFTWGKLDKGIELAGLGVEAAELQFRKTLHELGLRIRGVYESIQYLVLADGILDLQEDIGERLVAIAEESARAGFMTATDLLGARIKLKEVELARYRLAENRNRLVSELARLTGLDGLSLEDLEPTSPVAGVPSWTEQAAADAALAGNFDLALLDLLVESKRGLSELADLTSRGLPDLGLRLELSYAGSRFPFLETDWFRADDYQLTLSLGTSSQLFSARLSQGDAARARAELDEATERRVEARGSVRDFVRETYLALDLARFRLEYALLKQESWAADLEQKRALIRVGAGVESEYLALMLEALGGIAEAYGTLAEYRASVLAIEGAVGSAR